MRNWSSTDKVLGGQLALLLCFLAFGQLQGFNLAVEIDELRLQQAELEGQISDELGLINELVSEKTDLEQQLERARNPNIYIESNSDTNFRDINREIADLWFTLQYPSFDAIEDSIQIELGQDPWRIPVSDDELIYWNSYQLLKSFSPDERKMLAVAWGFYGQVVSYGPFPFERKEEMVAALMYSEQTRMDEMLEIDSLDLTGQESLILRYPYFSPDYLLPLMEDRLSFNELEYLRLFQEPRYERVRSFALGSDYVYP